MKRNKMLLVGLFALVVSVPAGAASMQLKSPELKPSKPMGVEQVFNSFGCTGGNVSPELEWTAGPEGTKSYVLTMYDPDAPTGSGWWHWLVFNIPASQTKLAKGAGGAETMEGDAMQSRTDFGKPGYGGPCPPPGKPHRYVFTVYALKLDKLPLDANASGAMVGFYANQNALGKATLTAKYGR